MLPKPGLLTSHVFTGLSFFEVNGLFDEGSAAILNENFVLVSHSFLNLRVQTIYRLPNI